MENEVKISLPKLGESIVSATVVQWFKNEGDRVELDEPLLEVSTDKVNSEIPSPVAGVLGRILAPADTELQVGETLAFMRVGESSVSAPAQRAAAPVPPPSSDMEDFLSPSVMRLLKEKKIPLSDIDKIPRSGQGGRLTKQDVEGYVPEIASSQGPCPYKKIDVERVKMSAMRKAIADNMVKSFYEAPHASLITEVDVTRILQLIQEQKTSFLAQHGAKLTITPFVARAICRALHAFPLINASLEGDTIVMKHFVNLGVAVSVDQGVMVPVIRNSQALSITQISQQIADLALKSREHRLSPSEVQGGTITMTNFGMTGTLIGIPIIRYPEVAIVGLGAIVKKVAAMPDNSIAIRSVMMISLTFDHRVLDGLYGCGFLNELKKHLEDDISL
ncbi:MAG TPA: branched-chain alpha-keto acid dehydrogenase subunit E2 [Parachlamydiales bacterium]|nr:branched-chain alpha-keto acid dehydrogenase subunit E2 [Parachlamydiales bacterium]